MLVLTIGLTAMAVMQMQAMKGNKTAFSRTSANSIALTFLEELKRLPFDDTNLDTTGTPLSNLDADLDIGITLDSAGNILSPAPNPAIADHQYVPANFPSFSNMFQVNGNNIVDSGGNEFQLFWNVNKTPISVGGNSYTPFCTLRLFMYWNTPMGNNSLSITTIKFNNTGA